MELCGGVFFCQTRRESNQGLKVGFLYVLNPGLEGFDTVLGGLFGLGGGVTPLIPMELWSKKIYFWPSEIRTQTKNVVSGGFKPRFRGFLVIFERWPKTNSCLESPYLQLLLAKKKSGIEPPTSWSDGLENWKSERSNHRTTLDPTDLLPNYVVLQKLITIDLKMSTVSKVNIFDMIWQQILTFYEYLKLFRV